MSGLGKTGERIAAAYLTVKGYRIAERNFHSRFGEIDLVAAKRGLTVFVEVKTRGKGALSSPAAAVDAYKQRKLSKTAEYYIMKSGCYDDELRFDVIEIELYRLHFRIRHIKNAFYPE